MDFLEAAWRIIRSAASATGSWFASPTAESWTAIGTWATVAVAGAASIAAFVQIIQARELRLAEAQPYVVASMEPNVNEPLAIDFVVRNYGNTAATQVRVSAEPRLRWTAPDGPRDLFMPTEIPTLAPGQEWRNRWDFGPARLPHHEMKDENRHVVTVEYLGVEGASLRSTAVLDWRAYEEVWVSMQSGIGDVARALIRISDRLTAWGPQDGLTVHPIDRDAIVREHFRQYQENEARSRDGRYEPPPPPENHLG